MKTYPYVTPITWEGGQVIRFQVALGPNDQTYIIDTGSPGVALEKAKAIEEWRKGRVDFDKAARTLEQIASRIRRVI